MASTGAYRQVLQQVFMLPIEEEGNNKIYQTQGNEQNSEEDSISMFDEFEEEAQNKNELETPKNITDYTEEDVEAEFANF